jgi:hypothetical protein
MSAIALMMEASHNSETSFFNETSWHYIAEGCNLYSRPET